MFCLLRVWCYFNIALFLLYEKINLFCIQFHLQSYLTWTAPFVKIDAITDVHIHSLLFHESCSGYFLIRFLLPSWYWIPVLHDDLLLKAANCNGLCTRIESRTWHAYCHTKSLLSFLEQTFLLCSRRCKYLACRCLRQRE